MAILTILFILLSALLVSPSSLYAQTLTPSIEEVSETVSTDPAMLDASEATEDLEEESSEYTLPYPGMLPNNPLYFLKSLRDSFIGFIISDPLKKAEFELLQADKKLAASEFLLKEDKQNLTLAIQSVEESGVHVGAAYDKLVQTDVKSTDSQSLFQKMVAALGKHEEVLTQLHETTKNDAFAQHAQKAATLREKVESYL